LKLLFEKYPNQIACVITEPEKSACGHNCGCKQSPEQFLHDAIELAHKNGALFIIDEMVSGFKSAFPGTITKFGLKPDMATWGKGVANGFSFCALTGTKEVMQLGGINKQGEEKVFLISTTHGGETHTLAAANATLNEFATKNVIVHNHEIGNALIAGCKGVIINHKLEHLVEVIPCNWLIAFNFRDISGNLSSSMRTLAMQEMISRGILFQGAFSPCFSHTLHDVALFVEAFSETLYILKEASIKGIETFLIGEPAKPVFRKML
jgi:spore coat polysaccharide biosynthesis protein SpsF